MIFESNRIKTKLKLISSFKIKQSDKENKKNARAHAHRTHAHTSMNEVALIIYLLMEQPETLIQMKNA